MSIFEMVGPFVCKKITIFRVVMQMQRNTKIIFLAGLHDFFRRKIPQDKNVPLI